MRERRFAVLSEHGVCRDCLVEHLAREEDRQVHGWTRAASLFRSARARPFDLVLLDLTLSEDDPSAIVTRLRRVAPTTTIIALGSATQVAALPVEVDGGIELNRSGLRALLAMARAIDQARDGRVRFALSPEILRQRLIWARLTRRQRQVLGLLGRGDGNQELAQALGISERSVKAHVSKLMLRFGVGSRAKLAVLAHRAALPEAHRAAG